MCFLDSNHPKGCYLSGADVKYNTIATTGVAYPDRYPVCRICSPGTFSASAGGPCVMCSAGTETKDIPGGLGLGLGLGLRVKG